MKVQKASAALLLLVLISILFQNILKEPSVNKKVQQ